MMESYEDMVQRLREEHGIHEAKRIASETKQRENKKRITELNRSLNDDPLLSDYDRFKKIQAILLIMNGDE